MRALGLVSLLIALVIVGLLLARQLRTGVQMPAVAAPGTGSAPAAAAQNPRQAQEQFKQSLDAAMQQPRAMPDDAK